MDTDCRKGRVPNWHRVGEMRAEGEQGLASMFPLYSMNTLACFSAPYTVLGASALLVWQNLFLHCPFYGVLSLLGQDFRDPSGRFGVDDTMIQVSRWSSLAASWVFMSVSRMEPYLYLLLLNWCDWGNHVNWWRLTVHRTKFNLLVFCLPKLVC